MKKGCSLLLFAAFACSPLFSQQTLSTAGNTPGESEISTPQFPIPNPQSLTPICGNSTDQSEFLPRLRQNKLVMEALRLAAAERGGIIRYVPIHFHLVGDQSGDGKHKEIKVLEQLCKLNAAFLPSEIQFYLSPHPTHGLFDKSINNDGVYLTQTNALVMNLRRHANAVNVYVVQEPVPPNSNNEPGGITLAYYSPSSDWIVSRKSETNGFEPNTTLPHEMGHLLSLPHTFYGYESNAFNNSGNDPTWPTAPVLAPNSDGTTTERQNATNCATAADEICDTPPDFNCGYTWPANCPVYNLGAEDPLGTLIVPSQNNLMSYFSGCSNYHFSQDQIDIMNADLDHSSRNYLDNSFVPGATDITTPVDLLVSPPNADTVDFYNTVLLEWQAVPGATHYLLETDITSAFSTTFAQVFVVAGTSKLMTNLQPNRNYYWRVKPFNYLVGCAVARSRSFRTPFTVLSTIEIEGLAALQISPNPVSGSSANLSIIADSPFEADLRITDAAGRTVRLEKNVSFPQGESTHEVYIEGLSNGLYFVSLESGTGRVVRKLSVLR